MSERTEPAERTRSHRLRPMVGRDPQEPHRAATPLELLFDLTFVEPDAGSGRPAASRSN